MSKVLVKLTVTVSMTASMMAAGIAPVAAQQEPPHAGCIEGPLTIVVARGPGGGNDLLSRMVGAELAAQLGVDLVVENVAGGGGASGVIAVQRAPADGRTMASWSPPGEHLLAMQGHIPFSAGSEEWTLIGSTNSDPGVIAVSADSPFNTLEEVLEASQERRLTAAIIGSSGSALEAMMYQRDFDLSWGMIPYSSGADLTSAILGGHVDFTVRQGGLYDLHPETVRILSVASSERIAELPDVPTVEEVTGQEIAFAAVRGLAVRADTPEPIVDCLRAAFADAARAPAIAEEQYERTGFRYEFLDGEAFTEIANAQYLLADDFSDELLAGQ